MQWCVSAVVVLAATRKKITMKKLIFSNATKEAALAVAGLVAFYLLIRYLTK